jgi:uncharacterized protein
VPERREVVCDTSPLLYLHTIEKLDLLRSLYGRILVPGAVAEEIAVGRRAGIPSPELEGIEWCQITPVAGEVARDALVDLGPGERESTRARTSDERRPRRSRRPLGASLRPPSRNRDDGTLGVLLRAKREGLILAIAPLVERLRQSGFRLDPRTRTNVLTLAGEPGDDLWAGATSQPSLTVGAPSCADHRDAVHGED